MSLFIRALLGLTFAIAAGCNKTEPVEALAPASAAPPPVRKAATDPRPVIVAFGNSISEGLGVDSSQNFPAILQRLLDEKGYRYRVVNHGISGDTTTGGLGRVRAVTALNPALVILELGGNDGLRGVPVASTRANLESLIETLKASGTTVVLAGMTLPPNYGPDYIRSFEQMYKDLADKHDLTLIPFLMQDIADRIARNPGLMQRDGIHPTASGHNLIAQAVLRYVEPHLKK